MENNKDIGKIFREKLQNLDQSPDNKVWEAINADLQKKKKRRLLPFWFTAIGIVLIVGSLIFFIGNPAHLPNESKPTQPEPRAIVTAYENASDSNEKKSENNNISSSELSTESFELNTKKSAGHIFANSNSSNTDNPRLRNEKSNGLTVATTIDDNRNNAIEKHSATKKGREDQRSALFQNKNGKRKGNGKNAKDASYTIKNDPVEMIAEQKKQSEQNSISEIPTSHQSDDAVAIVNQIRTQTELQKDSLKLAVQKSKVNGTDKDSVPSKLKFEMQRLNIFVYGSPSFGGYLSAKSPLDKDLDNNTKSFAIAISYGGYAIYDVSEKWSMRFGIGIENLKFTTNDATVNTSNFTKIEYSQGISNATIYSQSENATKMAITQHISYTEIPLEFKYAIKNSTIGINAYAGLSYRFLGKNEVSVKTSNGATFDIGKTENLARNAFAVHFGVGFDYKFSKKIRLNIEPLFKYHFLDYKNARATPYSFGILTGLQFSLH